MNFFDDENLDELLNKSFKETDFSHVKKQKALGEWVEEKYVNPLKNYPQTQRVLDLHGHTTSEAIRALGQFLINAQAEKIQTVQIITGKGWHSPNFKAVLPEITEKKLTELKEDGVVYQFKREKSGGSFLVYLT